MILHRPVSAGLLLFSSSLLSSGALARTAGIDSLTCRGCHGANENAELNVQFDPEQPEPGQETLLTITVAAAELQTAGLAIQGPEVGSFSIPAGEPLTTTGRWVVHTQPKPGSQGQAVFQVSWRAPSSPGASQFNVAVLAANGNGGSTGDRAAFQLVSIAYGCDPLTLFQDADGDGFGSADLAMILACEPQPGYSALDGDCDEARQTTYPGAPEMCNGRDDDCDGEIDEDAVYQDYYLDSDGDGFGDIDYPQRDCAPPPGYVDNGLDCDDADSAINPDAIEVCDYADNNCDGRVDENVRERCGVGLCLRESAFCGAQCIPGEPLEEQCNGLDDDCDGEIDESGCAQGESCIERVCVPTTTPTSSEPTPAAPDVTNDPNQAPPTPVNPTSVPSAPGATSTPVAPDSSAPAGQPSDSPGASPTSAPPTIV